MRHLLTMDFGPALAFPGGGEVVSKLHAQPRFFGAAERFREADGHLRADAGFSVDDVVQRLPSDAENEKPATGPPVGQSGLPGDDRMIAWC
jgi:hypothetical protein